MGPTGEFALQYQMWRLLELSLISTIRQELIVPKPLPLDPLAIHHSFVNYFKCVIAGNVPFPIKPSRMNIFSSKITRNLFTETSLPHSLCKHFVCFVIKRRRLLTWLTRTGLLHLPHRCHTGLHTSVLQVSYRCRWLELCPIFVSGRRIIRRLLDNKLTW